jgi:hypothetical protein
LCPTRNLEDQASMLFMSPSDRGAQLYPQVLGSLFAVFYDPRATVQVFYPASTEGNNNNFNFNFNLLACKRNSPEANNNNNNIPGDLR